MIDDNQQKEFELAKKSNKDAKDLQQDVEIKASKNRDAIQDRAISEIKTELTNLKGGTRDCENCKIEQNNSSILAAISLAFSVVAIILAIIL